MKPGMISNSITLHFANIGVKDQTSLIRCNIFAMDIENLYNKKDLSIESIRFFEMATIDKIEDMTISVYTDYLPKHFHVIKKDQFEVRLSINTLKVMSYKWQIDGKEITSKDLKKIQQWIKDKNRKQKNISNKQAIEFAWDIMNED